jgi:hypothetical protein
LEEERNMTEPIWLPLILKTDKVLAKPAALWTLVCEYLKGPLKLKIEATGSWKYAPTRFCGPDGSRLAGIPSDALNASAPLGALIGKIGGSPTDKPATSFVVGSYTVIALDEKTEGALFLTMNDRIGHFEDHEQEVTVTIQQARS